MRHLTRLGVTAQLTLGKDQLAVDTHFKDPAAALTERDGGAELPLELRRQTGGAGLVVSNHAVEDLDVHRRLRGSPKSVPVGRNGGMVAVPPEHAKECPLT